MDSKNSQKEEVNLELETFRQQWLSDLRSENEAAGYTPQLTEPSSSQPKKAPGPPISSSANKKPIHGDDDDDYLQGRSFDEPPVPTGHTLAGPSNRPPKELVSALDHFEEAMEREAQGNMGDSLKLYRQAYKVNLWHTIHKETLLTWLQLDSGVDRRYREKHFPASFPKPALPPSTTTQPQPSKPTTKTQDDEQPQTQSISELLESFSSLSIEPIPPEVEGMPQPPCPIASLPDELLTHILHDVATHDIAEFTRLSLVCRRLAYLVSSEQRIWRTTCLGHLFGFAAMHHHFALDIDWASHDDRVEELHGGTIVSARDLRIRRAAESNLVTRSLVPGSYPTWKALFRHRPRVRFNGCYISTVNYVRTGQMSTNQATWGGAPIHIVTYYRYLRFFRDGAVISLLTTSEPSEVVHHLTKEELLTHRHERDRSQNHHSTVGGPQLVLPSAVMRLALQGRWRLSSTLEETEGQQPQEGDLYIETEGAVGPRYMYRMDLAMRSAGKGARNNKLVWRGFYSYNKLTDDWGEFMLKNDKPFFFSRVKSYGFGK